MTIRTRLLALFATMFAVILLAQWLVGDEILLPRFRELERQNARVDMDRAADALRGELDRLAITTHDYGDWDVIYAFMADRNASPPAYSFSPSQLRDLDVDVLALIDRDGNYVLKLAQAPGTNRSIALALLTQGRLPAGHPWFAKVRQGQSVNGIVRTEYGPMLAALAPVLDGAGQGPARGTALLGRFLTAERFAGIARRTHVNLTLLPTDGTSAAIERAHQRTVRVEGDTLVERESVTDVYRRFDDIAAQPLFTLRCEVPRTITSYGKRSVRYATLWLVGAGAIVLALLMVVLSRLVLGPLLQLTRHAVAIGHDEVFAGRLELRRRDEIGTLAQEFDRMLDRLGSTQRALVDRSYEAGLGEMASGTLHNIGNAMTPLVVRLDGLRQRLRGAPIADLEMAIATLRAGALDAAQRADCELLAELLAREVSTAVGRGCDDAEAAAVSVQDVRQLIAEQRRFAHAGALIEPTELAPLLRACGEVIPEPLRERIALRVDASVLALGTVLLARMSVQQIAQNLILNAAEALRDAGRLPGRIWICAERFTGEGGARLELRFHDSGPGIAAEPIERIFERGYSTKPTKTNSGIGLHWCANAAQALGGRLIARNESDGACFVLTLPCPPPVAVEQAA